MKKNILNDIKTIKKLLQQNVNSSPQRVAIFFKTGPGDYAEHDEFIGITVSVLRKIAKVFYDASLDVLETLLYSKINEERLLALLILVKQYQVAEKSIRQKLYQFYMDNLAYVNNWNLVDSSAHLILGRHLEDKNRSILKQLAQSNNLWERRISIVATWYFIRQNDLDSTFQIAELLLEDKQDLIHKAVGWMLREAGKRNVEVLIEWLQMYSYKMPRTMLRYAIERMTSEQKATIISKASVGK